MHFRLNYRGPLKAKRDIKAVQSLRRHFHGQLAELWKHEPLSGHRFFLENKPGFTCILEAVGSFMFAPLITTKLDLIAELDVLMLRPAPPGSLVGHGGDLDNRMKTLLDALRKPNTAEIPEGDVPSDDERPFFCLMEDDALVTGFSVSTDRLLDPSADQSEVSLIIHVKVSASANRWIG